MKHFGCEKITEPASIIYANRKVYSFKRNDAKMIKAGEKGSNTFYDNATFFDCESNPIVRQEWKGDWHALPNKESCMLKGEKESYEFGCKRTRESFCYETIT